MSGVNGNTSTFGECQNSVVFPQNPSRARAHPGPPPPHAPPPTRNVTALFRRHLRSIIVVGESGTGKSTFVNNLFHAYAGRNLLEPGRSGGRSTPAAVFRRAPQELCTSFTVDNADERVKMHYSVQDTPGYGDSFDIRSRLDDIIHFIQRQQARYLNLEKMLSTDTEPDPRVDVCLYFVPPHRLKEVDIEFMKQLGEVVPLIPIIAKADSMTTEELDSFRELILGESQKHNISFFKFPEAALESVGATGAIPAVLYDEEAPMVSSRCLTSFPPFAVVSSEMSTNSEGAFWPIRRYQWGTCEAFNRQHSDCSVLKRLLLEEGFQGASQRS